MAETARPEQLERGTGSGSAALAALAADLERVMPGRVRADAVTRAIYATDASIYEVPPLAVAFPREAGEVAAALAVAARHAAPVLARGAGTSLAGQAVAAALVLDFTPHMNRVLELDAEARRARVEPGVVLDSLNAAARPHGLEFGPDVAPSNRATIGGMIGNNSCGAHSLVWGKTDRHLRALDVVFADASSARLERSAALGGVSGAAGEGSPPAGLVAELGRIGRQHAAAIKLRFPQLLRRVSGYDLEALLDPAGPDLPRLLAGSEGTLAVVTAAEVDLVRRPAASAVGLIAFPGIAEAMAEVEAILELRPAAVELIDRGVLEAARSHPAYAERAGFARGSPGALLAVEFAGGSAKEVAAGLRRLADLVGAARVTSLNSEREQADLWAVRRAGLGLIMGRRGDAKPVACIEDTAVPVERLPEYVRRFEALLAARQLEAVFYGHASVGCLHVRPLVDLKGRAGSETVRGLVAEVAELVAEFGGAMSGEHGDGRARSASLERLYGRDLVEAFREVKRAFDPGALLNPGNIVEPRDPGDSLRYDRGYRHQEQAPSVLDWSADGGFQRAVELCNGNGLCRKLDSGSMCPSYMATRDEEHSTRGRANALRAWLGGRLEVGAETEARLAEVLDLCLECKACRGECPSGVDMTKLKLEFLARQRARGGASLRERALGRLAEGLEAAWPFARLINLAAGLRPVRALLELGLGLDARRRPPRLAIEPFDAWFAARPRGDVVGRPRVLLLDDTFTRFLEPGVGRAAVEVLEASGYRVELAPIVCCGRPLLSKGFADEARALVRRNLDALLPRLKDGALLVGLEPSCLLTFRDEALTLCPGPEAERVAAAARLLPELVELPQAGAGEPSLWGRALVHGHCHQRALAPEASPARLLRGVAGLSVEELDAGCCGMAGSFGYEREHYDLSLAIGERALFKAVRAAGPGTYIVADGWSCRTQIEHATGRRALHPVELLALAQRGSAAASAAPGAAAPLSGAT